MRKLKSPLFFLLGNGLCFFFLMLIANPLFAAEREYTDPRLYQPYSDAPYQVTPVIIQTLKGHCREQSHKDRRDDAWRCEADNVVYDPCFVKKHDASQKLICPFAPWHQEAVMITIDAPLDNSRHDSLDMSTTPPWAVELTDGKRCTRLASPVQDGDSDPAYYTCSDNTQLIGDFYRCKGLWEVYLKDGKRFHASKVKRAWF